MLPPLSPTETHAGTANDLGIGIGSQVNKDLLSYPVARAVTDAGSYHSVLHFVCEFTFVTFDGQVARVLPPQAFAQAGPCSELGNRTECGTAVVSVTFRRHAACGRHRPTA